MIKSLQCRIFAPKCPDIGRWINIIGTEADSLTMALSFCSHLNSNKVIGTMVCIGHASSTLVAYGNFYCRIKVKNWITTNQIWHWVWFRDQHVRHGAGISRSQITKFMGPTWGPPGSCRPQIGPMLAPWTLLYISGMSPTSLCIKKRVHLQ